MSCPDAVAVNAAILCFSPADDVSYALSCCCSASVAATCPVLPDVTEITAILCLSPAAVVDVDIICFDPIAVSVSVAGTCPVLLLCSKCSCFMSFFLLMMLL